jgi:LacI family transcriptional regulator
MPPTIRAVARLAGVSLATVSNVIGKRRGVAAQLVAQVEAAVAELGYVPDVAASQLRSRRKTVIGLLVPDLANPFFAALVAAIERQARQAGFDVIVASSAEDAAQEAACLRTLIAWRPAGILAVPCLDDFAAGAMATDRGIPLVLIDRRPRAVPFDTVDVDNHAAAASAAKHLIACGYRSLLVVASFLAVNNIRDRIEGIRAAARCAAGPVVVEILEVGNDVAAINTALVERLAGAARPQCLFSLTNRITLAALAALGHCGLRVPHDIGLIGFDDYDWLRVVSPPITAVRQPVEEMGTAAWSRLIARLADPTLAPHHIELPCSLEIRSSTRCPGLDELPTAS